MSPKDKGGPVRSRPVNSLPSPQRIQPPGTPLQLATQRLLRDLERAREDLDEHAYEVLVDIAFRAVSREAVRVGLDEWRAAA